MPKRIEKQHTTGHRDGDPQSTRLSVVEDIARQIAVLVVRQHRRLKAKGTHEK
jgi:hypothetical protein